MARTSSTMTSSRLLLEAAFDSNAISSMWVRTYLDSHQYVGEVHAAENGVHRLNKARVCVDEERNFVLLLDDTIQRQRAMPLQVTAEPPDIIAHVGSANAQLGDVSPAQTLCHLPVAVNGDQSSAVENSLHPFQDSLSRFLNHEVPVAVHQIQRRQLRALRFEFLHAVDSPYRCGGRCIIGLQIKRKSAFAQQLLPRSDHSRSRLRYR